MSALKKRRYMSLLMRFCPEEMPDIIGDIFPGLNWETVKKTSVSLRLNLCKMRDLASACVHAFEALRPSVDDTQFSLWHLQFFDALLHKYLKWYGATVTNKEYQFPKDLEELHNRIAQAYRIEARKAEVIMKLEEDIVFVMLIEKIITKKGMRNGRPFFATFNISIDKQYIFYTPKISENTTGPDHLKLLAQALGFSSYKEIRFSGLDIRSMFKMIKNQAINEHKEVAVFQPSRFRIEEYGIDFTQGRERTKFALSILPPGLTNLKEFTVHTSNRFHGYLPNLEHNIIMSQVKITVKSRKWSVEDVFRELIARNMMKIPVPEYVTNFPSLDRNSIKINGSNSFADKLEDESWDDDETF